jgi:hypothetical protein
MELTNLEVQFSVIYLETVFKTVFYMLVNVVSSFQFYTLVNFCLFFSSALYEQYVSFVTSLSSQWMVILQ